MLKEIKTICFDADDTLWYNETIFRNTEKKFYSLLKDYAPAKQLEHALLAVELKNIPLYGFGIKAFILSMIETAVKVSKGKVNARVIDKILTLCKQMLEHPVVVMDGAEDVLKKASSKYNVVVATKGDILDQERKIQKSGMVKYLHHIEIMSQKNPASYKKLLKRLNVKPRNFLMIGNSLKSDIMPVLEIGAHAIYVPCADTWAYEAEDESKIQNPRFTKVQNIKEILKLI
jgi:putative hydrolase of the HAD superfamily